MKMKALRFALALGALCTVSCVNNQTHHVAKGELYQPGKAAYDAFFKDVNGLQKQAVLWQEDRKEALKPLWNQLSLLPDTPEVSVLEAISLAVSQLGNGAGPWRLEGQGTEVKVVESTGARAEGPFFRVVENTVREERKRAEKMRRMVPNIATLEKTGTELKGTVNRDFDNAAFRENQRSVGEELDAAIKITGDIARLAAREAQEADDFVNLIKRALATKCEVAAPAAPATPAPKGKSGDAPKSGQKAGGADIYNP